MSRQDIPERETTSNQYAVILPCEPDYFRDFIAGLLGKPQTITKEISGPFDLNKDDIANFYHLVVQRVGQQNEGTLIQFTVTIVYDDESTVLLNSFDDFMNYTEVRAVASTAAHLSWTFLVRFQDRNAPEKQQIDVSIYAKARLKTVERVAGREMFVLETPRSFSLRISHTARSWGADIEALLTGHIENLIKQVHPVTAFISRNYGWFGLGVGVITFLASIAGCFYSTNLLVNSRMKVVRGIQEPTAKADYIAELIASGVWPRFFFSILFFLFIAFVISIFLGAWTAATADNAQPSFLLLSKQAEKLRQSELDKYKKGWRIFVLSLIGSIIIELIGNTLFTLYLSKWIAS